MRGKEIVARILPNHSVKLVWTRLTSNRTTILYVSASFLLALTQIPLQIAVHNINKDARQLINDLLRTANISTIDLVPILTSAPPRNASLSLPNTSRLEVCRSEDRGEDLDDCVIVWADGGILQQDGTYGEVDDGPSGVDDDPNEVDNDREDADDADSDDNESITSGDDSLEGETSGTEDDDVAVVPPLAARALAFFRTPRSATLKPRPLPFKKRSAPSPVTKIHHRQLTAIAPRRAPFVAATAVKRALQLPDQEQISRRILPLPFYKRDKLVAQPIFPSDVPTPPATSVGGTVALSLNAPQAAVNIAQPTVNFDDDDDALTNIVGLRLTDPSADGSLKLVSSLKDAADHGVFGEVRFANSQTSVAAGDVVASFENPLALAEATVPRACALSLLYPSSVLHDSQREDLSLLIFHLWLFVLHLVGVLNESVVYIIVSYCSSLMAVGWSIGTLVRTTRFHDDFDRLIASGACGGVHVIPNWFRARMLLEIPVLVIGALGVLILSFLSWKLIKVYGWQTFKRIGPRMDFSRIYKVMISFSVCIQTAAFFVPLSLFLWLDHLDDGAIVSRAEHADVYRGLSITVIVFTLPWLALGWLSVRRENALFTYIFLALTGGFLAVFFGFYGSPMYIFTIQEWSFFAFTTTISVLFLLTAFVLGIWCKLQYGKGLMEALAETQMKDDADTVPWKYEEKGDLSRTESNRSARRNILSMGGDLEQQGIRGYTPPPPNPNPFADPEPHHHMYPMEIEKPKPTLHRAASDSGSFLEPPNRRVLAAVNPDPFMDGTTPVVAEMPEIPPPPPAKRVSLSADTENPFMDNAPARTLSNSSGSSVISPMGLFDSEEARKKKRAYQSMATTVSEGTIASWVAGDENGMMSRNNSERRPYGLPTSVRPSQMI